MLKQIVKHRAGVVSNYDGLSAASPPPADRRVSAKDLREIGLPELFRHPLTAIPDSPGSVTRPDEQLRITLFLP